MLKITDAIGIDEREIEERFVRAIGPGGQNASRDATAVELRLDITKSSLPTDVKARLIALSGRRVTRSGVLVVVSREFSSQARNRKAVRQMLAGLVRKAAAVPAARVVAKQRKRRAGQT